MKNIIICLVYIAIPFFTISQITPLNLPPNDPNWNNIISDDFPSTDNFGPSYTWSYLVESDLPLCFGSSQTQLTTVSGNSVVQLTCLHRTDPTCSTADSLYSGGIVSNQYYKYGYYTSNMELASNGQQYNAAFWMLNQVCSGSSQHWNELDFEVENSAIFGSPNSYPYPVNDILCESNADDLDCTSSSYINRQAFVQNSINLATSFNIYSYDWEPNYLTFYLNGTPLVTYTSNIPDQAMQIWFDLGWATANHPFVNLNNTYNTFPGYMNIDNMYLYQLNFDCSHSITFNQNSDISGFTYKVKNTITFGNGTHSIYVNLANCGRSSYVFRAENGITIPQNPSTSFTVPSGIPFMLIPTQCY